MFKYCKHHYNIKFFFSIKILGKITFHKVKITPRGINCYIRVLAKINAIIQVLEQLALSAPYVQDLGTRIKSDSVIVLIETDEGLTGMGASLGSPHAVSAIIEYELAPALIGEDPRDQAKNAVRRDLHQQEDQLHDDGIAALEDTQ